MNRARDLQYDRPRILLLQQDDPTAAMTAHRLRLLGYDVAACHLAEEVDHVIESHRPHLLLVDTRPSALGGIELVERLRCGAWTNDLPVLACSSDSSPDAIRAAHSAGASDYLLMPFDPVTLEHKVDSLLANLQTVGGEV